MKEAAFVKQNTEKWKHYEALIKNKGKDYADELANGYIKVTDDLAYASTFYPGSKTEGYLNQLSHSFHAGIYKNKKERVTRFISFFTIEIPHATYKARRSLLAALAFFLVAVVIGVVSTHFDRNFPKIVMGEEYVRMSMENIEHGDPMGVYKGDDPLGSFAFIAQNNIRVSFMAFAGGILLSIGSVYLLIANGIEVGAFFMMFVEKGLGKVALLSVFMHGSLELSAIIISAGAGMLMGNSILFPGTYSRIVSLGRASVEALKIVIGLVPVFITAAIFEGFVTRNYQEIPLALNLLIIIASFSFITGYFIILPLVLKRKLGWKE